MKTLKKYSSILLAFICTFILCIPVYAKDKVYVNDYFQYTVADESVTIINYYGKDSEVTVPAMIAGNPVNTIATGAFSGNDAVMKINLPDTIMTIEEKAFSGSQTVVYNSNTSNPEERKPTAEAGAAGSTSGTTGNASGTTSGTQGANGTDANGTSGGAQTTGNDVTNQTAGVDVQEADIEDAPVVNESDKSKADNKKDTDEKKSKQNKAKQKYKIIIIILVVVGVLEACVYIYSKKKHKKDDYL